VVAVFGRRGNDPGWCWCRRFLDPFNGGQLWIVSVFFADRR
jgi:hypothetical protein